MGEGEYSATGAEEKENEREKGTESVVSVSASSTASRFPVPRERAHRVVRPVP